jgi:hypothetical protein
VALHPVDTTVGLVVEVHLHLLLVLRSLMRVVAVEVLTVIPVEVLAVLAVRVVAALVEVQILQRVLLAL